MIYPTTGFHPLSPSTVISNEALEFDHERKLPKPMCGTATLTKLGILPSHTKRKQRHFLRKTTKQYQSIPIELTPMNTLFVTEQEFLRGQNGTTSSLFVTEQEFLRGQNGTTSSETGSSDSALFASPDSVEFSTNLPQLHVITALVHQDLTEEPIPQERPRSFTEKSSNMRCDFSTQEVSTEEKTEKGDYMVFEDGVEEPPLSPHSPPPMHQENSYIYVSTEVDNDDTKCMVQTLSEDYSSISSKEDSCESPNESTLYKDRGHKEEEMALIAMRDTILQQQENLQRLAIKNQQYRDRLAASHGRVLSLYNNHLTSMEAILKLQFERESFEAEAVFLREEVKEIRNSILYYQIQTIDHDQQPVEVPLTPYSFSSPRYASSQVQAPVSKTREESEKPSRASRDVEKVQPNFWTESPPLAYGRLSSLRSPTQSSSFSSQGSSANMTKDSESSTKTVGFHDTDKTHVEKIVDEQKTKLPSSPTTRWSHANKLELPTWTSPMSGERCEVSQQPLKQNLIRRTLSPAMPVESPSSGVPDGTSSSRRHEGVDRRRISDGNDAAEVAASIGWTSRHRIAPQVSSEEPERPVSPSNRRLQPCGQHRLNSQFSQNRTKQLQDGLWQFTKTDQMELPMRDCEKDDRLSHMTGTQLVMLSQSKSLSRRSPRSHQRTWEKPSSDGADLQTFNHRIWSSNPSSKQPAKCDETQPITDSLEEPASSEEKIWGDLSAGPSHRETCSRHPLIGSHAAHPKSPVRQRNDEKLGSPSPTVSPQQQLSPRSRYLSALTRPFPANSTIMLSKFRIDQGQSVRTATIQPKQRDSKNYQPYGKPKSAQPEFWENEQRLFNSEQSGEKFKPVKPERHRIQGHDLTPNLSETGNTVDPPLSSCGINGSKAMSHSYFLPEKRFARALEDYRDLFQAQNQTWADIASMKSHPALGTACPRATHHIPVSPTNDSVLLRKAMHQVRNDEGRDGLFGLKRQYVKVQKQARTPTMSYAEANAELRWVKSQQRVLESMKVNVDAKGSRGNVPVQKCHDNDDLVDPNNIEELNRKVDTVRMQLMKVTLEANEEREGRDDMEHDRDDLDDLEVHYGRE